MKIAFISDIHGNIHAFKAVLKDIKREKPDRIVFLGDASTLGMRPAETLERLEALKCDCILGNHDDFMIHPEKIAEYTKDKLVIDTVEWSRALHSERHLAFIRTFKDTLRIKLTDYHDIFCYHASPKSNMENIKPDTPLDSFAGLLDGKRTLFIGGHTHVQMLRNQTGNRVITAGSVGQPFISYVMPPVKHPWAEYATVSVVKDRVQVEFKQVPVDNDLINREIMESDSPMNDFISEF
ncbi:MAG TPA: metallophosphoesterase family protein [Treponemataceae bacterium]|jgi:predicted phosphodiesterase|nr:metallophosphoesterase family protein [Treponemataceae bacterium]